MILRHCIIYVTSGDSRKKNLRYEITESKSKIRNLFFYNRQRFLRFMIEKIKDNEMIILS